MYLENKPEVYLAISPACYIESNISAVTAKQRAIADDVMIASNAVVVKNIETCGAVVGGVPAKIIGMNSGWNMNQFVKGIEEE